MILPRYPIYVPSKNRFDRCLTAKFLIKDGVPFFLVVEEEEHDDYSSRFGAERILILPKSGQGLIFARNWIKDHATQANHVRHWQLDDNIRCVERMNNGKRLRCVAGPALAATEDFVDRYENVAVAGLNYHMFGFLGGGQRLPPFYLNDRVYSCSLILNSLPNRWRLKYNDDVDLCLQVLADGWCTILINAFLVDKMTTMSVKGGNTTDYVAQDGRLKMARMAERVWPGVVKVGRRFKRPQHVIKWRNFDTPLKLKPGIDLSKLKPNEYGMKLRKVK